VYRRLFSVCAALLLALGVVGPAPVRADPLSVAARSVPGDPRLGVAESYVNPDAAWTLGARWERVTFQWTQIQPGGPSDWVEPATPTLAQLQADHARGVDIVGLLINTPGWAQAQPSAGVHSPPTGLNLAPDDPANSWAQFCRKMAQRYDGVVSSWIIWNEPDVWDPASPFYTWAGDAPTYYQLLKVASQAIKSVQPAAKIVIAGTTFYWDANAGKPQFLGQVLDAAAADPSGPANGDYFDAVAAHVYTTATNAYWVPKDFTALLTKHGMQKPIWIDEMNVAPYGDPASSLPAAAPNATLAQQADFMLEAYADALAAGVQRIGVYKMVDVVPQAGAPYGLMRNDASLRPAYGALQTAVATLGGLTTAQMRTGQHHIAIAFPNGAQLTTVAWNTGPSAYTLNLCARGASARMIDVFGNSVPLTAVGPGSGVYQIPLAPATAHGLFDGRDLYYIGGTPVIVQEDGVTPGANCAPALAHDGRYFSQTGYRVDNDAFWSYFQARGGVATFGYPVSRTFTLLGFTTQLFQRQAMQLAPDGSVRLLNLLDPGLLSYTRFNGSQFPAADPAVTAKAPAAGSAGYAKAVVQFVQAMAPDLWQGHATNYFQTFQSTVKLSQAFPGGGGSAGLLPLLNLEVWGLPTSSPVVDPHNHNFVYQRFQRGVMHYDAGCNCTQGILFGDYLKEVITGQNLPADLASEVEGSPLFHQYDPDSSNYLARPEQLSTSDLTFAFERG
jgi:hypothetical protein